MAKKKTEEIENPEELGFLEEVEEKKPQKEQPKKEEKEETTISEKKEVQKSEFIPNLNDIMNKNISVNDWVNIEAKGIGGDRPYKIIGYRVQSIGTIQLMTITDDGSMKFYFKMIDRNDKQKFTILNEQQKLEMEMDLRKDVNIKLINDVLKQFKDLNNDEEKLMEYINKQEENRTQPFVPKEEIKKAVIIPSLPSLSLEEIKQSILLETNLYNIIADWFIQTPYLFYTKELDNKVPNINPNVSIYHKIKQYIETIKNKDTNEAKILISNLNNQEKILEILNKMESENIVKKFNNIDEIALIDSSVPTEFRNVLSVIDPIANIDPKLYIKTKKNRYDQTNFELDKQKYKDENWRFARSPLYISNIFNSSVSNKKAIINSLADLITYVNVLFDPDRNPEKKVISFNDAIEKSDVQITQVQPTTTQIEDLLIDPRLATFEQQRFFTDDPNKNIQVLLPDLYSYLKSPFKRVCSSCGYRLQYDNIVYLNNINKIVQEFNVFQDSTPIQRFIKIDDLNLALSRLKLQKENANLSDLISEGNNSQYAETQKNILKTIVCPNCKQNTIRKASLYFVESIIFELIEGLRDGKGTILLGNPGDGKSALCVQFLDWIEYIYGVKYNILNVDESTTTFKIMGDFSPLAIGGKTEDKDKLIKFGVLSRSLMKKGMQPSAERNVFFDELNRTDFRNFAFTMGFFAPSYEYLFEVANMIFKNPNYVRGITDPCWICLATMNISDVGNERLSLAYKSRFNSIFVKYSIEEQLSIIENILLGLSRSERNIFNSVVNKTEELAESGNILFPAGIRHLDALFRSIRRISNEIMQENNIIETVYEGKVPENLKGGSNQKEIDEKNIARKKFILQKFIESKLFSTIILPLSDESSKTILEKVKDDIYSEIPTYAEEIYKDLSSNLFNKYY